MRLSSTLLTLSGFSTLIVANEDVFNVANYKSQDIIRRDVAIVGGGSAGAYTGVKLKDNGRSVAIVEKKSVIGGHAETYTDPATGRPINLGVVVFQNTSVVKDYFNRFNIALVKQSSASTSPVLVNFNSGKVIQNFTLPSDQEVAKAFDAYAVQLARSGLTLGGSFNMSYPVKPDLLLSFPDFVRKYRLGNSMQTLFRVNQGYDLLNISTLYMFKYLNSGELEQFKNGFLRPDSGNTHTLYDAIQAEFARDIFVNSSILDMDRSSPHQVKICIKSGNTRKLIIAKKVVSCVPPVSENLKGYDLSSTEKNLFKQFFANGYYTGVLKNTGLNQSLAALDPSQQWGLEHLPSPYTFRPNPGTDLTSVYFGTANVISAESAQRMIGRALNKYQQTNGLRVTPVDFADFSAHTPFNLMVSNDAIKKGFYKQLAALQSQRNTFYNGAFLEAQDSSAIWKYTQDILLPKILASL